MKKFTSAICLLVGIMLITVSCRTSYEVPIQPELEELFIGKSYSQIIEMLGAPERVMPDGKDGNILVYEELVFNTEGSFNAWTKSYESITKSSKGYTHLYMTPTDNCYSVKSNLTREESEFSKGKTIGLIAGLTGGIASFIIVFLSLISPN